MRTVIALIILLIVLIAGAVGAYLFKSELRAREARETMETAREFFKDDKPAHVVETLRPLYESYPGFEERAELVSMLARTYPQTDQPEAAETTIQLWREIVEEHPESVWAPQAKVELAQALVDTAPEEAQSFFDEIAEQDDPELASIAKVGQAQLLEKKGRVEDAEALYLRVIEVPGSKKALGLAFDRLSEMNHAALYSPQLDSFCVLYKVKRGDSPYAIAVKNNSTANFLININRLTGGLRPGQGIKVPTQGWRLIVDKEDCYIYLLTEDGRFVKRYRCGVGELDYKTPEGAYKLKNKEKNPVWYSPKGGVFKPDDPGNELGTRWMGLVTIDGAKTGLGIHGTIRPETIGQRKSAGCIRMLNEKVEELFTITPSGTRVDIVTGFQLSDFQAKEEAEEEAEAA